MSEELTQWVRQLCDTTVPASSMSTLADRCVAEGVCVDTVGELLTATISEADIKALGLADYVVASRSKRADDRTDDCEGRLAAVVPDATAGGGDGQGRATSADTRAAVEAAGRLCVVGMGLGIGIGVGLALGSLVALKLFRSSGVKGKDALGLLRR
eukprot:COSAG02_NODE_5279_length_4477_cov_2.530151_3_plen_156_part_00